MSEKGREKYVHLSQNKMTDEEYQEFKKFQKIGNKHLEKNGGRPCSPWTTWFLTFLNMIQVFGDCVGRMDYSEPFRIVIDYDPEQVRVAIHHYSTDKFDSEKYRFWYKGESNWAIKSWQKYLRGFFCQCST